MQWPWQRNRDELQEAFIRLNVLERINKKEAQEKQEAYLKAEFGCVEINYGDGYSDNGWDWHYDREPVFVFADGRRESYSNINSACACERKRRAIISEYIKTKEEPKDEL